MNTKGHIIQMLTKVGSQRAYALLGTHMGMHRWVVTG